MFDSKTKIRNRLIDIIDLVVDLATLGEYGLEPLDAAEEACARRCEQEGRRAGWEALATPRRGSRCDSHDTSAPARLRHPGLTSHG